MQDYFQRITTRPYEMHSHDIIEDLRSLRAGGHIQAFQARDDRYTVFLKSGQVSASEEDVRQLVARAKIWDLLSVDA